MKTVTELNAMMARAENMLLAIGIPVPVKDICPTIQLARAHSFYGMCCRKGNGINKGPYQFLIRISVYHLNSSDKALMNTIIHELLHTCPDCHGHKGQWLKYANIVKREYGYDIRRVAGDKTTEERQQLRSGKAPRVIRYVLYCPSCGTEWKRTKMSKFVLHPEKYLCGKCRVPIARKEA